MSKNAVMPLSDYVDICDTIRGHLKINDKLTSDAIPPKIDEVFRQGASEAYAPAYDKGYADKSAEYNQLARDFSVTVYGEQKNETIENVVNTAITDIGDAKVAIESRGIPVPSDMPTSELHAKIMAVYDNGADIGFSAGKAQGRADYAEELLPYNQNLQVALKGYATGSTDKEVMEQATSDINAIEAKIEEKGVELDYLTPSSAFPEKIEEVYEKGYEKGKTEFDYDAAFKAGKKAQYDEQWDNTQDYGNRTNYEGAFYGTGWNKTTFNPKYDMKPTSAASMFRYSVINCDLPAFLESKGRTLDFSDCTSFTYAFYSCGFSRIGIIDCRKANSLVATFSYSVVTIIDKIIITPNITFLTDTFRLPKLEEIRFEGTIGQNGLNVQWSTKLSKASWVSIVGCYSTTISGLSMTGSLASVNSAFETSEGANDGSTSAEWLNLIATRPNVTFKLI